MRRFRTSSPIGWWWLLIGVNIGIALLLIPVVIVQGTTGLVVLLVLWAITDAILVPICLVNIRRTHTIDFATGVVTPAGRAPLAPADFVRVVHRQTAGRWGIGHAVVLQYRTGEFVLPLDEFARTPESAERREAVLRLIDSVLPVPDTAQVPLSKTWLIGEVAIGRTEAARLLLGPIDRTVPNLWKKG